MNYQFRLGGLVIKWKGVRHPILSDLSRSSRLSLVKYISCQSIMNMFASKSILGFNLSLYPYHDNFMLNSLTYPIQKIF